MRKSAFGRPLPLKGAMKQRNCQFHITVLIYRVLAPQKHKVIMVHYEGVHATVGAHWENCEVENRNGLPAGSLDSIPTFL